MLGRRLDWDPEQRAQKKEGRLQGLRQSRFLLRKEAQCAQDWDVLWFVGYIKENPGNSSIIRTVYLLRGVKTKQREPSLSSFLSFRWIWFRDQDLAVSSILVAGRATFLLIHSSRRIQSSPRSNKHLPNILISSVFFPEICSLDSCNKHKSNRPLKSWSGSSEMSSC